MLANASFLFIVMTNSMNNLTFIPDEITNDVEMLSWLEEQMARVCYDNEQWLQDQDEEYTESLTSRFSWWWNS